MTDKELLELAARATGDYFPLTNRCTPSDYLPVAFMLDGKPWNPLTDDGDAFRLAVKLGIFADTGLTYNFMEAKTCEDVRRLITEEAARIGGLYNEP